MEEKLKSTDPKVEALIGAADLHPDDVTMLRENDNWGGLEYAEWQRLINEMSGFNEVSAGDAEPVASDVETYPSTSPEVRKLLDAASVPHDDPIITQHDPEGLSLADWQPVIDELAAGLDWHDETEEEYIPPDCTVVAAKLFTTKGIAGWGDHGIHRALCVRAGPWDHSREAEIDGKVVRPVEFSDGGISDEPQNGLMLALVECFACPVTQAPVTVRFRTLNHQDPDGGVKGNWTSAFVLNTVYVSGGRESPAVQALLGATDTTGRNPSPPADPSTCKQWIDTVLTERAPQRQVSRRPKTVAEAVATMDRHDSSLWTREGKPKVKILSRIMGRHVTYTERNEYWESR